MAAGLSLKKSALDDFRQALEEGTLATLDGAELSNEVMTDGPLEGKDQHLDMARWFEDLGPWGQRFPEPLFDGRFQVIDARVVGGSHLQMIVQSVDGGAEIDAIAFNRLPEDLPAGGSVRMLYHLSINRWRGQQSCQLMVTDLVG